MAGQQSNLYVGIDSSLDSTGVSVLLSDKNGKLSVVEFVKIRSNPKDNLIIRYDSIIKQVLDFIAGHNDCIVAIGIEQPNTVRNVNVARKLIGLYQLIRYFIYKTFGRETIEVNTKTCKKFFTGNGNADKYQVVKTVNRKFKTKFKYDKNKDRSDDDICDSVAIAYYILKNNGEKNGNNLPKKTVKE